MSIIGDISDLITMGYKVWQGATVSPQEMFDKYVSPSYQLLSSKSTATTWICIFGKPSERIAREDVLSQQTVQWFTRARARRQADRSELRLIEMPKLTNRTQRTSNINIAGIEYLAAINDYFLPVEMKKPASCTRIQTRHHPLRRLPLPDCIFCRTGHNLTPPASQRAFAVEEYLESEEALGNASSSSRTSWKQ